jgi:hypothetical protein
MTCLRLLGTGVFTPWRRGAILAACRNGERRGWTIRFLILLSSCLTGFLQAQAPPPEPSQAPAQSVSRQLSSEELNGLLAPIALYPDALVALILR